MPMREVCTPGRWRALNRRRSLLVTLRLHSATEFAAHAPSVPFDCFAGRACILLWRESHIGGEGAYRKESWGYGGAFSFRRRRKMADSLIGRVTPRRSVPYGFGKTIEARGVSVVRKSDEAHTGTRGG